MTRAVTRERVPGQPDMWFFVLFEALVFTAYFVVYLLSGARDPQSQAHLNLPLGIVETLLLLASSWSVARCVRAVRAGQPRTALWFVGLTGALGGLFLGSKVVEWIGALRFTTNDFFAHYFFLTGIHALHLIIGFVALGVLARHRRSPVLAETCATYWHTVDLLWVLIFSLLYVVR